LDARKRGPADCHVKAREAAAKRDGFPRWEMAAKKRKLRIGPVPHPGAMLDQRTLMQATGTRAGVAEATRVLAGSRPTFAGRKR
jgi:hypothetical protein